MVNALGASASARVAAAVATATDGPGSDDDLLAWFFGERLGWPADLEGFLRRRAWADPQAVVAIARREAAFVGRPRPGAVSADVPAAGRAADAGAGGARRL